MNRAAGATPLGEVRPRRRERVSGVLSAVTYRPSTQVPALVGRLVDGSGEMEIVWLGRRTIPGVEPGRRLVAEGMVSRGRSGPRMYNPDYELLASAR